MLLSRLPIACENYGWRGCRGALAVMEGSEDEDDDGLAVWRGKTWS